MQPGEMLLSLPLYFLEQRICTRQTFAGRGEEAPSERELFIFQLNKDFQLLQPASSTIALAA